VTADKHNYINEKECTQDAATMRLCKAPYGNTVAVESSHDIVIISINDLIELQQTFQTGSTNIFQAIPQQTGTAELT
jgi:hypothetical protein